MQNLGTVWVVISASEAQKRLVSFVDSGYLIEATSFSAALQGLIDKMKSFVQQYGGSIPLQLYERIIMQIPSSAAEQIPSIVKGYSEALNNKIAVGMGLTMEEASIAAKKSARTGKIELHDPKDDYHYEEDFIKSDSPRRLTEGVVLPPNIFDPSTPDDNQYQSTSDKTNTKIPSLEEAQQGEMKLIQGITAQMGLQEVQQQQQQMQQQMQEQQAQQNPPGDLLESLNGGPVDGHTPEEPEDKEGSSDKNSDKSSGSEDSGDEEGSPDKDKATEELTSEIEDAESAATDDKIAMQLDKIKGQIPQIMGLADKDPKAFKQTMDMINKLIQLAHSRSKTTKKSETRENIEELIKDINMRASSRPKTNGVRYPVGTRLGRYKKVLIEGAEKWREMSSGAVQGKGGAISVRESNKEANDNQRDDSQDQ